MATVSVIAPVYNGEDYISEFIESIICQDYKDWELLLIDDRSLDSTVKIIDSYIKNDNRIKLIVRDENTTKGANACRNIGISHVTGEFFIILDSDDRVEQYCIGQRVSYIKENANLDFAVFPGKSLLLDEEGKMRIGSKIWGKKSKNLPIVDLLRAEYNFGVWNLIFRTESMSRFFWDENLKIFMDFDYIFRILISECKFEYDIEAKQDYGYIQGRSNAITSSFVSNEKYESTIYLLRKTMKEIKGNELYVNAFFFFYLSFFKKIIHSNNYDMYKDFFVFYLDQYHMSRNVRLKILDFYCRHMYMYHQKKAGREVDLFIELLFYPQNIVPKAINRMKRGIH